MGGIGYRHGTGAACGRRFLGGRAWLVVLCASIVAGAFTAGAQAEGICPNEALRQELRSGALPDCRAYELVSPVFKDGSYVAFQGVVSGDGSHMIGVSYGAFAGTESDPKNVVSGAVYEFSRTASDWTTSPLDPPASASPDLWFLGASRDLTRTLWQLRGPAQSALEADLYVREPEGRFVEIGPVFPPSQAAGPPAGTEPILAASVRFVGAATDLSHVVIAHTGSENNLLWPGDTTLPGMPSLYEYVGSGVAKPALVGVNPEGKLITEGKLISNCGTQLGGYTEPEEFSGDKYNAVSSDGKRVFFTAFSGAGCLKPGEPVVNEVYARINGAETVAISEPAAESQCYRCRTGHTATTTAEEPAEFQGASENGSKVFFTTTQELLEGQSTENLYEYDFNNFFGEHIVLVSKGSSKPAVRGVARVSEDGSHVYFVAKGVLAGKNREGNSPTPGADNLYVFERDALYPGGRLAFIATLTLSGADEQDWSASDLRPVQATPDGRFLVFASAEKLTAFKEEDTSTVSQIFEYDAKKEALVRVSIGKDGYNHNGNTEEDPAQIESPSYSGNGLPTAAEAELAVSSDGAEVFFTSQDALTPQAVEAAAAHAYSVYEYHSVGAISNGDVDLISDGKDVTKEGIRLFGTDASGNDVFFGTADSLLTRDTNTGLDIYDARVDGGFPEPALPVECEGEACQGPLSVSPVFGAPGSVSTPGGGNLPPAPAAPTKLATPKSKPLTRAQKLANALKACGKKPKKQRPVCRKRARRAYGPARKAKTTNRRAK
jgi:hypothetical protein